ncbi:hypothetical protein [Gordonia insulae]|nr:hypothetical protein [Gordonia insulae]
MNARGHSGWDHSRAHTPAVAQDGVDAHALSTARSRSGSLAVVTTQQGLPVSVRIDNSALAKDPAVLAGEILRLCQQSAMAAGIRLREQLIDSGVGRDVVDAMKLPRSDDLARAEQLDDHDLDAPSSWLRSV